jgi:hypothetical protein
VTGRREMRDAPPAALRLTPRASASGAGTAGPGGVTLRAALLAVILVMVMTPAAFVAGTVRGPEILTAGAPSVWPTTLLVLLAAVSALPFLRRFRLARGEVLAAYSLMLVAAPLSSYTVLFYVIPKAILYYQVARANPAWEAAFVRRVASWYAPTSELARAGFFGGKARVPWGQWWRRAIALSSSGRRARRSCCRRCMRWSRC